MLCCFHGLEILTNIYMSDAQNTAYCSFPCISHTIASICTFCELSYVVFAYSNRSSMMKTHSNNLTKSPMYYVLVVNFFRFLKIIGFVEMVAFMNWCTRLICFAAFIILKS